MRHLSLVSRSELFAFDPLSLNRKQGFKTFMKITSVLTVEMSGPVVHFLSGCHGTKSFVSPAVHSSLSQGSARGGWSMDKEEGLYVTTVMVPFVSTLGF